MTGAPSTVVQQIEAPNERVDGFVDAVQRRRKRGHEVEAISDGSNEEASLERFAVDRETIARKVGARPSGAWVHEVARGDRTEAAGAPDRGVVREARPGRAEPLREHASAFEYWRLVEEREARRRHRAGNRVRRVTVAVQKCAGVPRLAPKEIEQRVGRAGHCEREDAARQPFRKAKDVRSDARFNAREEGSGSTEACHDLVEDEIDAVRVARAPEVVEELRRPHPHPAGTLHERFRDERGQGRAMLREVGLQRVARFLENDLGGAGAHFAPRIVRNCESLAAKQQRPEDRGHEVSELTHPDGPERVAMVRVTKRANLGSLPFTTQKLGLERHLERDLHRGRAVVGEEAPGQAWWQPPQETRRQLKRGFVSESCEEHMIQRRRLTCQRIDQLRVTVAMHARPPTRNAVEYAASSLEDQIGPLAPDDRNRRGELVLFHLGKRMPDMGNVHGNAVCPGSGKRRRHDPDDARSHCRTAGRR